MKYFELEAFSTIKILVNKDSFFTKKMMFIIHLYQKKTAS